MSENNNNFDLDAMIDKALGKIEKQTNDFFNKDYQSENNSVETVENVENVQTVEQTPTQTESNNSEEFHIDDIFSNAEQKKSTDDFDDLSSHSIENKYENINLDNVQVVDSGEKPISEGWSLNNARSVNNYDNEDDYDDYDDEVEYTIDRKGRRKEKKQHGVLKTVLWTIGIIVVSLGIAGAGLIAMIDIMGFNFKNGGKEWVTIPEGASTQQIADLLEEKEVIQYPFLFRIYSKITGADGTYNYGDYELQSAMGYDGIIQTLQEAGIQAPEITVTIPERATIDQIRSLLVSKNVCSEKEFDKAMEEGSYSYSFVDEIPTDKVYYKYEGYLAPNTYNFFEKKEDVDGVKNAERAIDKMLAQTAKSITDDMVQSAKQHGYTVHQMLSVASILELEASGYPKDMAKVAQVFYNRLDGKGDSGKYLGSTPTAEYPYGNGRYNTNVEGGYPGLPPGPLCAPSADAIKAAFNPDTSVTATYFVTDKKMNFYYTNSLNEHNAIIAKLQSEGNWEY